MDAKRFYTKIREQKESLAKDHPDGVCYITSIDNEERSTVAGETILAHILDAARCFVENTHRLATDEEIEQMLERTEARRKSYQMAERARAKQTVVLLERDEDSALGQVISRRSRTQPDEESESQEDGGAASVGAGRGRKSKKD